MFYLTKLHNCPKDIHKLRLLAPDLKPCQYKRRWNTCSHQRCLIHIIHINIHLLPQYATSPTLPKSLLAPLAIVYSLYCDSRLYDLVHWEKMIVSNDACFIPTSVESERQRERQREFLSHSRCWWCAWQASMCFLMGQVACRKCKRSMHAVLSCLHQARDVRFWCAAAQAKMKLGGMTLPPTDKGGQCLGVGESLSTTGSVFLPPPPPACPSFEYYYLCGICLANNQLIWLSQCNNLSWGPICSSVWS